MLTVPDIEECLSRAYVYAVAGRAGVNLAGSVKDYGTDGTFREVERSNGIRFENGWSLDFQLKASINCSFEQNDVVYDLDANTYRKLFLRRQNGATPIILIVLSLPSDAAEWLVLSEDELLMRWCCYWWLVQGAWSDNTSTVRIRIPRCQQLTPDGLAVLFQHLKDGTLQ